MYEYRCEIVDWIDGDTAKIVIDLGFRCTISDKLRIAGINAPEIKESAGEAARRFAYDLAPPGSKLTIRTAKADSREKYGRFLASIALADGRDFAAAMVEAGHARPYGAS